ncbi:hypothetical protein B0T24DRAFT_589614 [Lasiosphaeria ovina]|uniref:Uncharacterized protein n=1 Tax=Lasiosphaeria ovina TaxID=92902 RepID=A0AAE0KM59_9PEZI|nr:hypothetical protein B0T24DRAFT_589614 [Lasiosphaeria ovina]
MATHGEVLKKVSQLAVLNAELVEEIASLEQAKTDLDQRFETNLSCLYQAIRELPVVIDVLMLETPPPLKLTFVVRTVMADISRVEGDMRASQQEASKGMIATADLACKAAEHIELCSSVGRTVSDAQRRTKSSLDESNRRIASAQQEIADTNRMSSEMASQARRHDENAEGNSILFWTTFWIPIVNAVTIPVSLSLEALTAEIVTKSAEKVSLEAIRYDLDNSLARLNLAQGEANERARHAAGLRDQAKLLMDNYGIVTTRVKDVLRALDHLGVGEEVTAEGWNEVRTLGLLAFKGLLVALKERELLAPECSGVAEMLEGLKGLEDKACGAWELEF